MNKAQCLQNHIEQMLATLTTFYTDLNTREGFEYPYRTTRSPIFLLPIVCGSYYFPPRLKRYDIVQILVGFLLDPCYEDVFTDVVVGSEPRKLLLCLLLIVEDTPLTPTISVYFQITSGFSVPDPRQDQQLLSGTCLRCGLRVHRLC